MGFQTILQNIKIAKFIFLINEIAAYKGKEDIGL